MIFQHRDGEMRLYSGVTTTAKATMPYYMSVLFVNAGFNAPIARTRPIETLIMDRGVYTDDAEYIKGMDEELLTPLPLSFEAKLPDDVTTWYFVEMLTGTSPLTVRGKLMRSAKGESKISGISTPQFADTSKMAWDVEVKWDGSRDFGVRWREVYFPGDQIVINESVDEVTISVSSLVYGDVTRIPSFRKNLTGATPTHV